MKIEIRTFAMLREIVGTKSLQLETESQTAKEVVLELCQRFPDLKKYILPSEIWNEDFIYAINSKRLNIKELGLERLHKGDQLAIIPPAGGG